jgi:hypothetical protein
MKWEYLVRHPGVLGKRPQEILDEMGEQGWELVTVDQDSLYFKRPIQ